MYKPATYCHQRKPITQKHAPFQSINDSKHELRNIFGWHSPNQRHRDQAQNGQGKLTFIDRCKKDVPKGIGPRT